MESLSFIGALVVGLIVVALVRRRHQRRPTDLGVVSNGWIAQHRVSWYDEHH
jgi:hypothetical protein